MTVGLLQMVALKMTVLKNGGPKKLPQKIKTAMLFYSYKLITPNL